MCYTFCQLTRGESEEQGESEMAGRSGIEWTEKTWNPVTGCTKISQGCKFCYAERMAKRLYAMGSARYENKFQVTLHEDLLELPLQWKKPSVVFVNSMSDMFHKDIPLSFIQRAFEVMEKAHQHTFQVLTKRADRLLELSGSLPWPPNVWMGVSVEQKRWYSRIQALAQVPAKTRFLSCEPLLEALPDLPLQGIHWVIVGGESGPGARTMREEWADGVRISCEKQDVPFFFKQWGGVQKWRQGRLLNGVEYNGMPDGFFSKAAQG